MSIADKLTTIAENEQRVFDAGKKSEYDAFWDTYQQNGNRTNYNVAFGCGYDGTAWATKCWNDNNFKPKYDIRLSGNTFNRSAVTNLKQRLLDCGVKISNVTSLYFCFYQSAITHIPDISITAVTNMQNGFNSCTNLISIDGIKVAESCVFNSAFNNCTKLEHVIFYGTIGNNLSFQWSDKLDKESITSIVSILSTSLSGRTLTLSKDAVNNAFETAEGLADGTTSTEWAALIADKSNWTISLV